MRIVTNGTNGAWHKITDDWNGLEIVAVCPHLLLLDVCPPREISRSLRSRVVLARGVARGATS